MPLLMDCSRLQPGMRLAEAFIWNDRVMMTGDTVLTGADVRALQTRFPKQRFRIKDDVLDGRVDFEDDSYEREVAQSAQRKIARAMSRVQERISQNATLDDVSVSIIRSAINDVVKYLEGHPVEAALIDNFMGGNGYLSERAGNVFYLAMMLGTAAHDYVAEERKRQTAPNPDPRVIRNLVPLGVGAMLMDVGMVPLKHLYEEDTPLTPQVWRQIRQHPADGAKMLPKTISSAARNIVRTHHENIDGSGYPEAIPGDKLHVFTRIARIVDAYDAATATRVYDEAKSPVRVLWEMTVGPYSHYYDQALMKVFSRLIQPFPIGAKIRLEAGQYAVVVRYNRENPLAPLVIVAFDEKDRRLPDKALSLPFHLGSRPDLRAASFAGEDISFIYDEFEDVGKQSRVGFWPTLFEAAFP
ncbi:MAG: HD domain-containing protein [Phycisphaerae bacterium]|nr:HD domain-containing protein [Phycisphaerae bacterium]